MVKPPSEIILVVQDDMYRIIRRASIVTFVGLSELMRELDHKSVCKQKLLKMDVEDDAGAR